MAVDNITDLLEGYSKAIYSTWFYYAPDRFLLDAGEGAASRLENRAFAIRRILLSHGHLDHISGLPTLLHVRSAGKGDNEKPLEIYYPAGDAYVMGLMAHLGRTIQRTSYELSWIPLEDGAVVPLTPDDETHHRHARRLETFATMHTRGRLTLGYRVMEERHRLKPEFAGKPESELREAAGNFGSQALSESYSHSLLAYTGDCIASPVDQFLDTDVLFHEATFMDEADREAQVHSTLDEAVQAAVDARAGNLVLYHVSSRYPKPVMRSHILEVLDARGYDPANTWLVYEWRWERMEAVP